MKVSKPVLFVFLGSVLLSVYLFVFAEPKKVQKKSQVGNVPDPVTITTLISPLPAMPKVETQVSITYFESWGRDPFYVEEKKKTSSEEERKIPDVPIKLYAIIEGKKGRLAIIGDEIVSKGDIIKTGEKVVDIGRESVSLEGKGSRRTILLEKE
ncbi:MAG: hypothetical protein NZ583_03950 [Desulfobacterota bacterium]|nr:hypothetical protein [Thermodesulfobacteriota bacterium]MDW8001579.1 hypothetical protein [Deltaproteobacteria bacterium]